MLVLIFFSSFFDYFTQFLIQATATISKKDEKTQKNKASLCTTWNDKVFNPIQEQINSQIESESYKNENERRYPTSYSSSRGLFYNYLIYSLFNFPIILSFYIITYIF